MAVEMRAPEFGEITQCGVYAVTADNELVEQLNIHLFNLQLNTRNAVTCMLGQIQ